MRLAAPSPAQLPACAFCPRVRSAPDSGLSAVVSSAWSGGPVRAARWALLPEALGGSTRPGGKGSRSRRCPRGRSVGRRGCLCPQDGARGRRVAVCDRRHSVRLPVGAVQTPPPWQGAEGPPGSWDGKGEGDHSQSCSRTAPTRCRQNGPRLTPPRAPGRQLCPMSCPVASEGRIGLASALTPAEARGLRPEGPEGGGPAARGAQPGLEGALLT